MDKKSRILIVMFAVMLTASVVAIFYRYVVLEDIDFHIDENAFQESLLEE